MASTREVTAERESEASREGKRRGTPFRRRRRGRSSSPGHTRGWGHRPCGETRAAGSLAPRAHRFCGAREARARHVQQPPRWEGSRPAHHRRSGCSAQHVRLCHPRTAADTSICAVTASLEIRVEAMVSLVGCRLATQERKESTQVHKKRRRHLTATGTYEHKTKHQPTHTHALERSRLRREEGRRRTAPCPLPTQPARLSSLHRKYALSTTACSPLAWHRRAPASKHSHRGRSATTRAHRQAS